jgi:hypothetical protein
MTETAQPPGGQRPEVAAEGPSGPGNGEVVTPPAEEPVRVGDGERSTGDGTARAEQGGRAGDGTGERRRAGRAKLAGGEGEDDEQAVPSPQMEQLDVPDSPGTDAFRRRDRAVRRERHNSRQSLGGTAQGAQATGEGMATVSGDNWRIGVLNMFAAEGPPPLRDGPLSRTWLQTQRTLFVETAAFKELADTDGRPGRLRRERVQILYGREGTGRTTTALLALAAVVDQPGAVEQPAPDDTAEDGQDPDRSCVRVLLSDTELVGIPPEDLIKGCGYLLDRSSVSQPDSVDLATLRRLRELAANHEIFLIVVVDDRARLDRANLREHLVEQDRPDPRQVYERHRDHLLEDTRMPTSRRFEDELRRELDAAPAPAQVAELARVLVDAAKQELTAGHLVQVLWVRLLARARSKLANPFKRHEASDTVEALRRRALLLACLVLDGLPLATVTTAAARLAVELHERQNPGEPLPLPIFGSAVDDLLDYAEASDEPPEAIGAQDGLTRRVWMRPGLPAAVLETAWRHYDAVRGPLIAWLQSLAAQRQDPTLQVRAAAAVGKLATYDFEYISTEVIDGWAASPDPSHRWAAAWALEMAAEDPRLAERVRRRISDWCQEASDQDRQRTFNRQRTALLAFTTSIATRHPGSTLQSLAVLAKQPHHGNDWAVALGLRELFLAGCHAEVRYRLADWARLGEELSFMPLQVQAARGLLAISQDAVDSDNERQDVLRLFATDPAWRETSTNLWRLALNRAVTSQSAWDVLWIWLRRAGREPELAGPVEELVSGLVRDEHLRARASFYQLFWARDHAWHDTGVQAVLRRALAASTTQGGMR